MSALPGRVAGWFWLVLTTIVGLALVVAGWVTLQDARDGIDRQVSTINGVPVTLLAPPGDAPHPSAIVAHGFAGSRPLMDGVGLALADAGFTVALLDFAGHGANPQPLEVNDAGTRGPAQLTADLRTVAAWLAAQPGSADSPPVLVGHSMGAGAVVAYAADAAPGTVAATVALSLPSAEAVPAGAPADPANLLLLWGSAEPDRFQDAALAALTAGYPQATAGPVYGDAAAGTARSAQEVSGAEHLSILWRGQTLTAIVDWSSAAVGLPPAGPPTVDLRMAATGACALGTVVLLVPLATLVLGNRPRRPRRQVPWLLAVPVMVGGAAAGAFVGRFADESGSAIPLAVGGYIAVFFVAAAAVSGTLALVLARTQPGVDRDRTPVLAALLLTAVMTLGLALPGRLTWAPFAFVGDRPWLAVLFVAILGAWFTADECLVRRRSRWGRAWLMAANRVIIICALLLAVLVWDAPGFLTLLVPLMVPLFALLAGAAVILAGRTNSVVVPALVQAVPLGLLVATTFPLVSYA